MSTNTSGGTTTSFMNTPQAKDDFTCAIEDGTFYFDVMSNDLGGNAKILWSIDDSNLTDDSASGTYDLLSRDGTPSSVPERSDLGALISIVNGVVKYDSNPIDSLAAGQTVVDKFTYAIRMSNGTLSWATVYITLTGTNDGVSIVAAGTTASGAVVEDSAQTASPTDSNVASGTIAFDDPDLTDVHTAAFAADPANTTNLGTFALGGVNEASNTTGGTVGWTYTIDESAAQSLAAGQVMTEKFVVTITDPGGLTATQIVTVTITGTNDGPVANADLATTSENAAILVNVLANDTDLDNGAVLTVTAASAPAGQGAASVVSNKVQFDPGTDFDDLAVGQSEVVVVSYTISDEHGATSSSTVTITVTGTNDGPVANPDTATTSENASILVNVLTNDTDVDNGAVLTVTAATAPAGQGTASVESNQVRFHPGTDFDDLAVGQSEIVTVSYTISDEHGATSSSTVTITVTGTNDGPVANPDIAGGHENETLLINVLANDTDVDNGAVLTVTAAIAPAGQGSASVVGNQVQFAPGTDFDDLAVGESEVVVVSYTISDEHGATSNSTVTITVTGTNDGPVANPDVETTSENVSVLVDVLANDTDVDNGAVLTVTAASAPPGQGTASVESNQVRFDPGADFDDLAVGESELVIVSYTISDEHGATSNSTVTITVTGTNDGPVANLDTDTTSENASLLVDVLANDTDVDNGAVLTVTAASAPAGQGTASVESNQVRFHPGTDFDDLAVGQSELVVVSYTISDEHGATSSSTVTITVTGTNDGPVANPDIAGGHENETLLINVLTNDTDVDNGAVLTVTAASAPAGQGSASVVDNQVQFSPGTDFDNLAVGESEVVVITYTISDEHGATSNSTVTITVTGTNDGPVANPDTDTTSENASILVDVLANDTDVDNGAVLTVTAASAPAGQGTASVESNQVRFYPGTDFDDLAVGETEVVTVSYSITDEHGATSDSTVTITVTGTNDGPVANPDIAAGHENQTLLIDVLANDTDVDNGAVLTVTAASVPAGQGSASVASNEVQFDPGTDFDDLAVGESELVVVSYTISDEHGATSNSTLTITVTGTNDGPMAVADTDMTSENATVLVDVLANDTDVDNGAVLTVTAASAPSGQGTASVVGNQVQFDPGADFDHLAVGDSEVVIVSYSIEDEHGATSSSTLTITVTGANDGPVANPDTDTTAENATVLVDVLANDTDADAGAILTVTAASAPAGQGTASVVGDQVQFDPGTDFDYLAVGESVVVTVSYSIEDEHGAGSSSTLTITVTGTNDGPTAVADTAATGEDSSVLIDVLANDTDPDTTDTPSVTAANVTTGLGTATIESGQVRYDPGTAYNHLAVGQTANVVITYSISDGHGGTSISTVAVTVTGTNDNPDIRVEAGDSASVTIAETNAGLLVSDTLTVIDADTTDTISTGIVLTNVSGNQGSLTNAQLLAMLSVVPTTGLPANTGSANNLTWTFNSGSEAFNYLLVGQSLQLTYTLTVSDGHGGTDTQTVTVEITGTADGVTLAPVYTGDDDPNNFDTRNDLVGGTTLVTGTSGDDTPLNGTNGNNTIRALGGNDTVNAQDGNDTVYGSTGDDTINGGSGGDSLYGQAGNDIIHGNDNNDQIWGGSGNDQIFGDQNNDQILWGGSGVDTISGGDNADRIAGGFADDTLTGGTGNDVFVYLDVRDTGDTITDFQVGSDDIDLSALDANSTLAGNQTFAFGGTTATANGIWYEQVAGNTFVYVDTDGDVSTAELWITLNGTLTLTGGDFIP